MNGRASIVMFQVMAGLLAALCLMALVVKVDDWCRSLHAPTALGVIGASFEALVFLLLLGSRSKWAALLMTCFAAASCILHLFGLLQECRCLGGLDRWGGNMTVSYSAIQGLLAVSMIALDRPRIRDRSEG